MGCSYRFNRLFNVSKTRAGVVAILCFLAGIPFMHDAFAMIGLGLWGYALIYGCIWFYKFSRDTNLKHKVEQEQLNSLSSAQVQQPAQQYNPDSNRLFLPGKRPDM